VTAITATLATARLENRDTTGASTVTLAGDIRETINASQLPAGVTEEALCTLPGANYDNLTRGDYTPNVELPDQPPLFP